MALLLPPSEPTSADPVGADLAILWSPPPPPLLSMPSLNDLPVELLLEVIQLTIRYNKYKPIFGVNAAWTGIGAYNDSIRYLDTENIDEMDPLPPSTVSIHADILSLRLTSSTLNALCTPYVFAELNILKKIQMPFDDFYGLIVEPYAKQFRTLRILLAAAPLSDANMARILMTCKDVTTLMLYHENFQHSLYLPLWHGKDHSRDSDWMDETSKAIVTSLESFGLVSLGIYSLDTTQGNYLGHSQMPDRAIADLFYRISSNQYAYYCLLHLDIALWAMQADTYYYIRTGFNGLRSLTVHHALRPSVGKIWGSEYNSRWFKYVNLTHLQLRKCAVAYAPHIPHLVRHFISLKFLLIAVCGFLDDVAVYRPPNGWYSDPEALWQVRKPLDVFQLEHEDPWEIEVMGEIPTRTLIIANLDGDQFVRAFQKDLDYFPGLQKIRIEPRDRPVGYDRRQFSQQHLDTLMDICQKRFVTVVEDATPTSRFPDHCWNDAFDFDNNCDF